MALIVGKYKIERMDRYNLRAFVYRVPDGSNGRAKTDKPKWMPMEAYFGNMTIALEWLYDRLMTDAIGEKDFDAASMVRECQRIKNDILDAVGDAVGIAS